MAWRVEGTVNPPYYANIEADEGRFGGGSHFGMTSGRPIDPEVVTHHGERLFKSGYLERKRKKIPAVMDRAGIYLVSETFRILVEEFEPNRHQFFPFALRNGKRGAPADEPYYLFNITNRADSIVWSDEEREKRYHPPSKYFPDGNIDRTSIHKGQDDQFSLRRKDIGDFHLWWEASIGHGFFVSDEFLTAFDKAKLKCLERVHVLEV